MSSIPRFVAYAAAFEKAFASDDWSVVEPFFTEDAEYEVGLGPPFTLEGHSCVRGRDTVLAYFKAVLDRFDRRFATRELKLLEGPREDGDRVWIRGSARYTAPTPELPDLEFALKETATFRGDRIQRLEDHYEEADARTLREYFEAHAKRLGLG